MNPGGIFKVLLWTAPVVAILYFYITQQQQQQTTDMKLDNAQFDEEFASMNAQFGKNTEFWDDKAKKSHEKAKELEQRAAKEQAEMDDSLEAMKQELENTNPDDFRK